MTLPEPLNPSQLRDWTRNAVPEENHMHGGKAVRPGILLMAAVIGEGVHCSSMTSSSPPTPGGK